ncbi:TPR-like protein [Lizonia empirigonia]|nr:TPR-like protein [Lizonia empirigonia]
MAATKKDPVLRVTGLAASQPDEELTASLKAAISDDLTNEEKAKIDFRVAVVPSCYNNEEKVALVECRGGLPAFLSALTADPLGEWQMEMGDTDINFDQHFFGFTQLYTPASDTPVVADVIAITGLDGHAYGSWRGKGSLGRMWLRDFLCKDLPCCRTMIYGYNSKLSSHGVDTIMDYGRGLLEELKKVRGTEELRRRPLFFIAHSFGGIILAHCLVKAAQITEDHPTIAALHRATYSMLLFGIPHRGLVVDDIQKMLAGEDRHPRRGLLKQIREKSDLLASQLDNFRNLIQDRKVVSFYETGQTRQLQFDRESKRWTRTGDFITAVDSDSALLQLPDAMEEKIPLDADHSMMVKFDNKNALGYSSARDKLRQFAQDAPGVVADRFARAQNRLKPCNMVPFPPDSAFVGREDVLAKLKKIHSGSALPSHSRAALVGLGGVGKSQIAIEYAYRVKEAAPHMWVFWVHASNAARFKQAYQEIAARIELPGRDDPKTNIFRLVYNWLCDERNGRWLMIVDNADDDRVFASPSATDDLTAALASFLPQAANGWILVTSRDRIAAVNLVGARHNVIQVKPMGEQEALTLLKSKTRVDESSEGDARALVKTLEGIPLAVTHAAAYITANEPMVDIVAYLELFRESEENQAHLLNDKARDIRRDASVSSAVITTWQLSFEQIRKTRPEAADLLSLMTMFDRQGVPEHILYEGRSKLQFTEAVGPLLRFSLVRAQAREQSEGRLQGQLFEMHNLVQLATKKWLELREQVNVWQRAALRIMAAAFPSGQHETWAACQTLLPHSTKVLDYSTDKNDKAKLDRATIATNTAWYLMSMGQYAEAERHGRSAVAAREEALGREHPNTLTSVSNLGSVLERQGKYEEAEAKHRRALEGREKVLGPEHPDTLTSVSQLGSVLESQGKYEEAEAMHRRDLEGSEKVLGPEHPDTLTSVSNLGSVLERQGKYEEAEAKHRRALEGREKVLGPEHPDTLTSVSQLGSVLESQGKYEEAEAKHRRALEGREKVLGPEHPDTLTSVSNLGSVLERQGKYEEAEAKHRRALEGYEKVLGPEHPNTLTSVSNLGSVLERQGKYEEAEAKHRRALEGYEKVLGPEHPDTLTSVSNLGSVLWSQGQFADAETLETRVMEARKRVLGDGHPDTLTAMANLAFTLRSQGRCQEALSLMEGCVQVRGRVLGLGHPDTEFSTATLNQWRLESLDLGT